MKDTGKTINGVKLYSDPECPPDTLYMLNHDFKNEQPPRRSGTLTNVAQLTQSEKLEALIERAMETGFDYSDIVIIRRAPNAKILAVMLLSNRYYLYFFIFNHDFAKALFGQQTDPDIFPTSAIGLNSAYRKSGWQYHLQQAVIAPDPIDYMYEEVFGK